MLILRNKGIRKIISGIFNAGWNNARKVYGKEIKYLQCSQGKMMEFAKNKQKDIDQIQINILNDRINVILKENKELKEDYQKYKNLKARLEQMEFHFGSDIKYFYQDVSRLFQRALSFREKVETISNTDNRLKLKRRHG